jgi:hypothetical protein
MLGSESGSNVFDFEGRIKARYDALSAERGRAVSYQDFAPEVEGIERQFDMGQISPRVFECAAMMTPMIMYRGRYSGIVRPDEHYICLEKDFSNIDAVLARLKDLEALQSLSERAHKLLVASGDYGYASFGRLIEDVVCEHYARLIDDRWLNLRRQTMPDWRPMVIADVPQSVADAKRQAYREVPTRRPLGADELKSRVQEYARLYSVTRLRWARRAPQQAGDRAPSTLSNAILAWSNSRWFHLAQRGWSRLPLGARSRLRRLIIR